MMVYRADGDVVEVEPFLAGAQAAERLRPLLNRLHGGRRGCSGAQASVAFAT